LRCRKYRTCLGGRRSHECRTAFAAQLDELERWLTGLGTQRVSGGGSQQPFPLAYQEENNRNLLKRYGDLCARLMRSGSNGRLCRSRKTQLRRRDPCRIASKYFGITRSGKPSSGGGSRKSIASASPLRVYFGFVKTGTFSRNLPRAFRAGSKPCGSGAGNHRPAAGVLIYPEVGWIRCRYSWRVCALRGAGGDVGHPRRPAADDRLLFVRGRIGAPPCAGELHGTAHTLPNLGVSIDPGEVKRSVSTWQAGHRSPVPLLLCPGMPFNTHVNTMGFLPKSPAVGPVSVRFLHTRGDQSGGKHCGSDLKPFSPQYGLNFDEYVIFIPWLNGPAFDHCSSVPMSSWTPSASPASTPQCKR